MGFESASSGNVLSLAYLERRRMYGFLTWILYWSIRFILKILKVIMKNKILGPNELYVTNIQIKTIRSILMECWNWTIFPQSLPTFLESLPLTILISINFFTYGWFSIDGIIQYGHFQFFFNAVFYDLLMYPVERRGQTNKQI